MVERRGRAGWSSRRALVALALVGGALCAGCVPALEPAYGAVDPAALGQAAPRSLTVLPVDVTVSARDPGDAGRVSFARSQDADERVARMLGEALPGELSRRGYAAVPLAWDGSIAAPSTGGAHPAAPPARALPSEAVANLADWLLTYGGATAAGRIDERGEGLGTPLPFPTEATLYVGGVGVLVKDETERERTAEKVAVGVAIAVAVIAVAAVVVGVLAAIAKGGGGHGGGHGGGGLFPRGGGGGGHPAVVGGGVGGHLPVGGVHAPGLGQAVGLTARAVAGAATGIERLAWFGTRVARHTLLDAPRATIEIANALLPPEHVEGPGCNRWLGVHDNHPLVEREAVAEVAPGPETGLLLTATLVDNRTGRILWTSAQQMPVDPIDGLELRAALGHILETMPHAGR